MANAQGIGSSVGRLEGLDKVTGKAIYVGDMHLPGMLVGKLLRSPLPHARVLSIDTRQAKKLAGVKAVVHADGFQNPLYGPALKDASIFPRGRVRYVGEPVAAVAAVDADVACEALSLIQVEYEPLEPVFDPLLALAPDAPILHPDLSDYETVYRNPIRYGNVPLWTRGTQGDIAEGLARADRVFEHTVTTPTTHAGHIEPHATLVQIISGNRAAIWTTTQQPFIVRSTLAEIFSVGLNDLQVVVPNLGGGFGGKEYLLLEPYCYLLALEAGLPVKMVMTREEEFQGSCPRHATHIELTTGVMNDGRLVARKARLIYDTGAYTGQGPFVTACGLMAVFGPYRIEHREGEALCVYTNKPNSGSYRGYGFPQPTFASETQLDLIAAELGMDPLELRLRNAAQDGDTVITGQRLQSVALQHTLRQAAKHAAWQQKRTDRQPYRGIGIACGIKAAGMGASAAFVKINEDGSATILSGTVDLGTGSTTVLAQIVSQELGIPLEQIDVCTADTRTTPFDVGSIASRVAYGMNAVMRAAQDARHKLVQLAADYWMCDAESIAFDSGHVRQMDNPERVLNLSEIAAISHRAHGGPIIGIGSFVAGEGQSIQLDSVEGFPLPAIPHFVFGAQVAEVEVDPETGHVRVLRLIGAHDVGKALNPLNVRGQIEGGLVMGMSAGLFEEMVFVDGVVINANLVDFKMPTAMDVPELVPVIVEHGHPDGPYGAKGLGEVVVVPTPAAIANAVFDAVGVMVHSLPITAEKLLSLMPPSPPLSPSRRESGKPRAASRG